MSSDTQKLAAVRRKIRSRLSRTVARLSVEDIIYLTELAERLIERSAKPVLPNIMESFDE